MSDQQNKAAEEPQLQLSLPLSGVNFILASLDKNPLGGSVAEVSGLMARIQHQAQNQPEPKAPSVQAAVKAAVASKRGK